MLKNYLKIAVRNILKNKAYSFIIISGLAIGLAACFIIYLYVSFQLSFDDYNKNINNIYLVYPEQLIPKISEPTAPLILGSTLKNQFPDVVDYARWKFISGKIKINSSEFDEDLILSDPSIFNILTLPIKFGNIESFVRDRNSIVISETAAKKYFGNQNPIDKTITLAYRRENFVLKVVAVIRDVPKSSTFVTDFIAPLNIWEKVWSKKFATLPQGMFTAWDFGSVNTYVLLSPSSNLKEFQKKLSLFSDSPERTMGRGKVLYHLFPVKDIYFNSSFMLNNLFPVGNISNVYIYSTAAFLVLFISIITLLMFSIGRASLRTKEFGVRGVIGARKKDFLIQNIIESVAITFIALPVAIMLVEIFLPNVSQLIGERISSGFYHRWKYLIYFWGVTVLVGIIAGSFISFYISKFKPIDIFKNVIYTGSKRASFRKIMIAFQMIVFTVLIFASIIIYKQLNYFLNKNLGFDKEGLVVFYPDSREIGESFEAFKNELKKDPNVLNVSGGSEVPGSDSEIKISLPDKEDPTRSVEAEHLFVDKDFIETMGMKMKLGKTFRQSKLSDSSKLCIINETAMRELGINNPIGEKIMDMEVIGVVKDFNIHSLHKKILPVVIERSTNYLAEIAVRIREKNKASTIAYIRKISKEFNKGKPMEYQFMNDRLGELYQDEQRFGNIIEFFTVITTFVACLGLFGMSLFISQQRVKEIGVRKVMGASITNISYMLTKEFIGQALIAEVIAIPITIYLINKWLQNFAYKINYDIWIFVISISSAVLISLLAVGYHAIKAATANPIKSLRYE